MTTPKPYHHGSLRTALIAAALEIVEQDGAEALSLRSAARAAGVSQAAPYAHFSGKSSLLAAVAATGFEELANRLEAVACTRSPEDLVEFGLSYLGFAQEHPGLYRVMFGPASEIDLADPEYAAQSGRALKALRRIASQYQGDDRGVDVAAWSLVHGLATLGADERLRAELWGDIDRRRVLTLLMTGVVTPSQPVAT